MWFAILCYFIVEFALSRWKTFRWSEIMLQPGNLGCFSPRSPVQPFFTLVHHHHLCSPPRRPPRQDFVLNIQIFFLIFFFLFVLTWRINHLDPSWTINLPFILQPQVQYFIKTWKGHPSQQDPSPGLSLSIKGERRGVFISLPCQFLIVLSFSVTIKQFW